MVLGILPDTHHRYLTHEARTCILPASSVLAIVLHLRRSVRRTARRLRRYHRLFPSNPTWFVVYQCRALQCRHTTATTVRTMATMQRFSTFALRLVLCLSQTWGLTQTTTLLTSPAQCAPTLRCRCNTQHTVLRIRLTIKDTGQHRRHTLQAAIQCSIRRTEGHHLQLMPTPWLTTFSTMLPEWLVTCHSALIRR